MARKTREPSPKSEDEMLDQSLEDTFPASDPPSQTDPNRHVMSKRRRKSGQQGSRTQH